MRDFLKTLGVGVITIACIAAFVWCVNNIPLAGWLVMGFVVVLFLFLVGTLVRGIIYGLSQD